MNPVSSAASAVDSFSSAVDGLQSAGRSFLDGLDVAGDPLIGADPVSFLRSLVAAGGALARKPAGTAAANGRLAIGLVAAVRAAAQRAVGGDSSGPASPAKCDKRFVDQAYTDNPLYFLLKQQYLLSSQLVTELLDAAELDATQETKARFAAKFIVDALAPTNTLVGNPVPQSGMPSTQGARASSGARRTCWTTSSTTEDGPHRSTTPASRSASTWPRPPVRSSTGAI